MTIEQIRSEIAPFTLESGKCKDSKYVLEYINDARRLLWPRGNFSGLVDSLRIRVNGGQVTLPHDYQKAIDARQCRDNLGIDNEWYEYADNIRYGGCSCWGNLIDLGDKFATFLDYVSGSSPLNHRLVIKGEIREDEGKEITFNAIGEHGDRVQIVGRVGKDHQRVTFNPWIKYFRYASKEKTIGRVRVYIFDPNRAVEKVCAIYEPDDLAPKYRRYRVPRNNWYLYLKCKRRYRDLLRETDEVEFCSDALIQACLAITHRRNKSAEEYTKALNLAVEHENQILKDDQLGSGGRLKMSRQRRVENLVIW